MRISGLSQVIPGADEQGVSLLTGYQSNQLGLAADADGLPIDLTNQEITAKAEIYTCTLTFGSRAISIDSGSLVRAVDNAKVVAVAKAPDQLNNKGQFQVTIPESLIEDVDLEIDSTTRALAVVYFKRTFGDEVRPSRTVYLYGRGLAKDA